MEHMDGQQQQPQQHTTDTATEPSASASASQASARTTPLLGTDGRPFQIRPCKYYPSCAKMDDPEHNAMYSHTSVVKKSQTSANPLAPRLPPPPAANLQLCGFGEHCKRCGDEEHLDKYIHSCKFGQRCKKMDDAVHVKRFIHILPGSMPPVAPYPPPRSRHGPFGYPPAYPPPYPYPYMTPPLGAGYPPAYPAASSYPPSAASYPALGTSYPAASPPAASHHARPSASSYHPYARGGEAGSAADRPYGSYYNTDRRGELDRPKDDWNTSGMPGYSASAYGDLRAAAEAFNAYNTYNSAHLGGDVQYAM